MFDVEEYYFVANKVEKVIEVGQFRGFLTQKYIISRFCCIL